MGTVHAIFEDGVFRPINPVVLPDQCEVEFEPRVVQPQPSGTRKQQKIYEILDARFESGFTDTAERHNEHQP
jgi:predicted DNA-binding antitoxin AbrB/MazE fold protein